MSRLRTRVDAVRRGPWLRRGAWTLADQALFAGANFLVNVLLARWLSPEGFGAYTVAYTVFLLLGTLHAGFLVEPMLVYGAARFERRLEAYLRVLLTGHGRFSLVAGAVLGVGAVAAWTSGQFVLGHALAAFAVGQAFILFQWLMRSACYVRTQPHVSALTGVVYAGVMVAGVAVLNAFGWLNEATGIGLMAGASLAAGTLIAVRLGVPRRRVDDAALIRETVRKHREYGGWAASTGALEWYHGFLPFLLLPLVAGLGDTGALRAVFILVLPVLHVFHAVAHLLVPVFVRARAEGTARRVATTVGVGLLVLTVGYALAIHLGGAALMHWLYDGKYDAYSGLLWIVAVLPIALVVSNVGQALLRAQERPEAVFAARAGASVVATTVGATLVVTLGVAGALLADLASTLTEAAVMLGLLRGGPAPVVTSGDHAPDDARPHVLVVAFACGPGRGSEPGQGWEAARRLSDRFRVTALVYSGFRAAIDAELGAHPAPGLRVVYHRLPLERARHHADGEDRDGVAEQLHYHVWQTSAGRLAARLHEATPFDAAHHVSFMRYWSPSAAASVPDVPLLWGPVGGGESAPAGWGAAFPLRARLGEAVRSAVRSASHALPSVRRTARRATLALATTQESAARMRRLGAPRVVVPPASVALRPDEIARLGDLSDPLPGPVRFIAVGRLLAWKGTGLALDAFARAAADPALDGATFWIVGDGPDRARLARKAARLGLADRVHFTGMIPREDVLGCLTDAHVLVHPSLHDSGGYATLEGMAAGRPVVCLDLGGPGLQVTPATGIAVPATTPEGSIDALADAFQCLAADPDLRRAMGEAGRARVAERYAWDALADDLAAHIEALLVPTGDGLASSPDLVAAEASVVPVEPWT